jgi:hypothetical protein
VNLHDQALLAVVARRQRPMTGRASAGKVVGPVRGAKRSAAAVSLASSSDRSVDLLDRLDGVSR